VSPLEKAEAALVNAAIAAQLAHDRLMAAQDDFEAASRVQTAAQANVEDLRDEEREGRQAARADEQSAQDNYHHRKGDTHP
jgi:hypothetical protein